MYNITHLHYRGDFFEVSYTDTGDIHEVILFPGDGRRGEVQDYWTLSPELQHHIQEAIGNKGDSDVD